MATKETSKTEESKAEEPKTEESKVEVVPEPSGTKESAAPSDPNPVGTNAQDIGGAPPAPPNPDPNR